MKEGDEVVCIDNSEWADWLVINKIYKVEDAIVDHYNKRYTIRVTGALVTSYGSTPVPCYCETKNFITMGEYISNKRVEKLNLIGI